MAGHCAECTGCQRCAPKPKIVGYCEHCKEAIYGWEDHYELGDDVMLHEDCLTSWATKYLVLG